MIPKEKRIIIFIYNSYKDPLFQSNLFKYLKYYQSQNQTSKATIITFEQSEYALSEKEKVSEIERLNSLRINWISIKWHSGNLKLFKKIFDLINAFIVVLKYRIKGYNKIISLGTVAGTYVFIYSKILRLDHFIYQYEPHFKFLVDFNPRLKKSIIYKMLTHLETKQAKSAKIIATGTNHMINDLENGNIDAEKLLVPSCVDENKFYFSPKARGKLRKKYSLEEKTVVIYQGKFDGLYYGIELFHFFKGMRSKNPDIFFFILTREKKDKIEDYFQTTGINSTDYKICSIEFNQMPDYLSIGDIGIVSVPPLPTQKYRSPIKVGEYLCCGLPYIVCKGISEDDIYAKKYNVGVVVNEMAFKEGQNVISKVDALLSENRTDLRQRCRKTGIEYRGYNKLRNVMMKGFEYL